MHRLFPLALLLAACSATPARDAEQPAGGPPEAEKPLLPPPGPLPAGAFHRTARTTDFAAMTEDLAGADIVYVGESHTTEAHHVLQLRVIENLAARGRLHAIGMEMFQRTYQDALDDYVRERIDEEELLARTDYEKRWGYDFALYRPIVEFARKHRLRLVALNLEDEIRRPARKGGLDAVADDARATLPALDLEVPAHRAYLERVYREHLPPGRELDEEKFGRFYLIMVLWDEVMADSIVRWFREAPAGAQMVVLAGQGHIANRYGIPGRVHRRLGTTYKTVVPAAADDREAYAREYADFVFVMPPAEK